MEKDWSPQAFQDELARLPQVDAMVSLVRQVCDKLLASRRRDVAAVAAPLVQQATIHRLEHQTTLGDALAALERGPQGRREQVLLGALLARAVAGAPPAGVEAENKMASELLWLAAHGGIDAFPSLDVALGAKAAGLWGALCDLLRRIDRAREASLDRADAAVGALALRNSGSPEAQAAARKLADEVEDPALAELLRGGAGGKVEQEAMTLAGELQPAPRSPWLVALTALTGWMLLEGIARLVARAALQRRQPAVLELNREGLRLRARTEMLGRVLREVEHVVPIDGLSVASREVRFPRLVLYAGLLALALGSYLGASLLGDGIKAASPSLLGQGALLLALGIAIELGTAALFPGARGRCRVILIPKKGRSLCLGDVDADAAQRALASLPRHP
jgi:hypothetical protein